MEMLGSIMLAICYCALVVLVITITVSLVAIFVGLVVQAFKYWREEDAK